MKAYTDIEKSKKLAEILPVGSADLWWDTNEFEPRLHKHYHQYLGITINPIPCWSLAALLQIMPKQLGRYTLTFYWCDDSWCCSYIDDGSEIKETSSANNPVDATVEMIVKLKEKDLL